MNKVKQHARNIEIASLYKRGLSLQAVGNKFDLSGERVRQLLFKMGVPTRKWGRPRDIQHAED